MKICFVYQADYPWDVRVEKIARSLTAAGHEVAIVCANEQRRPRRERLEEAHVWRLPALSPAFGPLNEVINFPAFFNPLWLRAIDRCVRGHRADLVLVRDLPLALTAAHVARRYRIPVAMDMAECYPELLRSIWQFGGGSLVKRITHNPRLGDWAERAALRVLDHVFVMVDESRERLLRLGADPERVSVVSNTPPLEKFATLSGQPRADEGALHLLYAGWVNKGRGVDTVIDGVARFRERSAEPLRLTVIGDGDALDGCRRQVEEYGLADVVELQGWQDNSVVVEHTRRANVGLVPHHLCGHWNNTVPNKLFDYMASSLPVLSSNTTPVSRILQKTGAGLVYEDWSPSSFATALEQLSDPSRRRQLGECGRRAVREHYNWEKDSARLLADIARLGEARPGRKDRRASPLRQPI